ncbi:MAG: DNA mismatch endonuclease Vsr [Burkholderiales bacterium]|nr:DNA mismatch endonuclease Vsr [Burkholderiales bacterium]
MVDVVSRAKRSRMMAGIGVRDTKPELLVRRRLHANGLRYSLSGAGLPGRPDIVLRKWNVVVFVHGCFWHWHGCRLSKLPSSNSAFWRQKLTANRKRDALAVATLHGAGWRVATVWECALRGATAMQYLDSSMERLTKWIRTSSKSSKIEISMPVVNQFNQDAN